MQSIVSLLFVFTGAVGLTYGVMVEKFKSPKDVTTAMEDITKTLVQLIVFYFFAAQFLYAFGASNMGALIAIAGAEFLKSLALPPQVTIFGRDARPGRHPHRHHHLRCDAEPDYYLCFR